jgi:hypothetical protein
MIVLHLVHDVLRTNRHLRLARYDNELSHGARGILVRRQSRLEFRVSLSNGVPLINTTTGKRADLARAFAILR